MPSSRRVGAISLETPRWTEPGGSVRPMAAGTVWGNWLGGWLSPAVRHSVPSTCVMRTSSRSIGYPYAINLMMSRHPQSHLRARDDRGPRPGPCLMPGPDCGSINSPTLAFNGADWKQVHVPKCQRKTIRTAKLHYQVKP